MSRKTNFHVYPIRVLLKHSPLRIKSNEEKADLDASLLRVRDLLGDELV